MQQCHTFAVVSPGNNAPRSRLIQSSCWFGNESSNFRRFDNHPSMDGVKPKIDGMNTIFGSNLKSSPHHSFPIE